MPRGILPTADSTLQHQRRRNETTASSTQAANATPTTSAARKGGFVVKRPLIPRRYYHLKEDNTMTICWHWLGRDWLTKPCHNWLEEAT